MILKIVLILSILINFIFIYMINRKKIKKIIFKPKIKSIDISKVNKIFELRNISHNLKGPKIDTIVKSFNISPKNRVIGMTSDYEAWIISSLSKISKNIFEFGTCSGKTTYLMALNSPKDAKVTTITLEPEKIRYIKKQNLDNNISFRNIINESVYNKFLFSGEEVEKKIDVIFQNSLEFNETKFKKKIDLIFIDGGHTYSIVKNDTEKAFSMLNVNGIILWHDYVPEKKSAYDVVRYLNELSSSKRIYNIQDTSLCFFKNN